MFEGAKHSTVQCEHEISPILAPPHWHGMAFAFQPEGTSVTKTVKLMTNKTGQGNKTIHKLQYRNP